MSVLRSGRLMVGMAMLTMGCARDIKVAPDHLADPATTLTGDVVPSPRVSIIAVGGTQQLSLNGVSLTGQAITTFDSVSFVLNSLSDTTRVLLTSTGLVTGRVASTSVITINAIGYKGAIAGGDQALVMVTAAVIPGLVLSVQPVAPDSAKLASTITKNIVPVLKNPTTGVSIANPPMIYTVKPEDAARLLVYVPFLRAANGLFLANLTNTSPGTTNGIRPTVGEGSAWVYGALAAYGTLLQDSVLYTFSYPYTTTIQGQKNGLALTAQFTNSVLTLAPGATVTFSNGVGGVPAGPGVTVADPLQMAWSFDNPAAATAATSPSTVGGASGNVTVLSGGQSSQRRFLTPGTYHWTLAGTGGPAPWPGQTVTGTLIIK